MHSNCNYLAIHTAVKKHLITQNWSFVLQNALYLNKYSYKRIYPSLPFLCHPVVFLYKLKRMLTSVKQSSILKIPFILSLYMHFSFSNIKHTHMFALAKDCF